jgi:hypothetical protein
LVAVLTYVALIAPVLSFVDFGFLGHSFVADHFFYLPMIGLAPLLAGAAASGLRRLGPHGAWMGYAEEEYIEIWRRSGGTTSERTRPTPPITTWASAVGSAAT